ncbi:MAG TPA: hypothetical protein VII01_11590 [Solirubrobacteraceae bacterium]|jgi:hypothetical protein
MSRPEPPPGPGRDAGEPHYGRYVGALGIAILVFITINTIVTKPNGATGIPPGQAAAPFAVPLVQSTLNGAADVATRPDEGAAGRVPACKLRRADILNICQLYEHNPVVLALFVDAGSCPGVLSDLQTLSREFPAVRFAGVAIKGDRGGLRTLMRSRGLSIPIGIDSDGALAVLYKTASCPQLSFIYPGGIIESGALLRRVSLPELRRRVRRLVADSRAHASATEAAPATRTGG